MPRAARAPDVVLVPDLSSSLNDGVAVRAHVRARLLGLRLLRLEADVVLVPARTFVREAGDARDGTCLLDARRLLAESEELLDRVRGTGAATPATWWCSTISSGNGTSTATLPWWAGRLTWMAAATP